MSRTVPPSVRSGPSRKSAYLRFINRTGRYVNVYWIDFGGYPKSYGTLHPNREFDVHSYVSHPWVCEDWASKTRLLLNKKEVFYPTPASDENGNNDDNRYLVQEVPDHDHRRIYPDNENRYKLIRREYVYITLPVFTLIQLSAEVIVRNVRNAEDINTFQIPAELKNFLQTLLYP